MSATSEDVCLPNHVSHALGKALAISHPLGYKVRDSPPRSWSQLLPSAEAWLGVGRRDVSMMFYSASTAPRRIFNDLPVLLD